MVKTPRIIAPIHATMEELGRALVQPKSQVSNSAKPAKKKAKTKKAAR
jgi:hypothetical protein